MTVSEEVKTDIRNAINARKIVYVPKTEMQIYGWRGSGYVVLDPDTMAGSYMISGGIAGGNVVWTWSPGCILSIINLFLAIAPGLGIKLPKFIKYYKIFKNGLSVLGDYLTDKSLALDIAKLGLSIAALFVAPSIAPFILLASLVIVGYKFWFLGEGEALVNSCTWENPIIQN